MLLVVISSNHFYKLYRSELEPHAFEDGNLRLRDLQQRPRQMLWGQSVATGGRDYSLKHDGGQIRSLTTYEQWLISFITQIHFNFIVILPFHVSVWGFIIFKRLSINFFIRPFPSLYTYFFSNFLNLSYVLTPCKFSLVPAKNGKVRLLKSC